MNQQDEIQGVLLDSRTTFTLIEFTRACGVERSIVVEMVEHGLIEPTTDTADWQFNGRSLVRAKRALRLVGDLGLNLPGAALALELMDQIQRLEARR